MPPLENDRPLLDAFRRGDRAALSTVYFEHVDELAALVRRGFVIESQGHRVVPGAGDADAERELVQETFVRAFAERARQAYDGLRPYRPYLLRIAKNLLIDRLRARSTMPLDELTASDDDPGCEPRPERDDPAEQLHWKRLMEVAQGYLGELDAEARTFVRLRFEEERSQEEIAATLRVSRRRIRTLQERVESGLLARLKKLGIATS